MKLFLMAGILAAMPAVASAQDRPDASGAAENAPERCVAAQVLVPPFNNSPGAMEQSRIAASTVEAIRHRRGEAAYRVCRTSAIAPEFSEIEGVDEKPLTEEEMRALDPDVAPPTAQAHNPCRYQSGAPPRPSPTMPRR